MMETVAGQLVKIWLKRARRGPMESVSSTTLVAGRGMAGNANQGGSRQITLIEQEVWDTLMAELGGSLPPSARRANLLVRGFPLAGNLGRSLQIGVCRLGILGETKPCEQMEAALAGLQQAMCPEWRGGAYGEVLVGGVITVGDPVGWA